MAERFERVVTLKSDYQREDVPYGVTSFYRGVEMVTRHIYSFTAEDGEALVWKGTTSEIEVPKGSVLKIRYSVKGTGTYKGKEQTVIQRVKVVEVITRGQTREEWVEEKKNEQLSTLSGDDFVWHRMPYSQYKSHYSDCDKVIGSYDRDEYGRPVVDVIIREGRLKNSGTRGMSYGWFTFVEENGNGFRAYHAVSEENAWKRLRKEMGEEADNWKLSDVDWSHASDYYGW